MLTDEQVEEVMEAEFADWEKTRRRLCWLALAAKTLTEQAPEETTVFLHPCRPGGLPDGWQTRWHAVGVGVEVVVVERTAGGWTMMLHWDDEAGIPWSRQWLHSTVTPVELYETLHVGGWTLAAADLALRDYIVSLYDLTNPVEAVEAVLVGLGAEVTVFPRALTRPKSRP